MGDASYPGGCLCGRTRYRATGRASNLCFCHCRSCRRASGAPFVAWGTFGAQGFACVEGEISRHASSEPVLRGHCSSCGTALTYEHRARPGEIDVTLASLDEPGALEPVCHIWVSNKLPWVVLGDGLPQYAGWRSGGA